MHQQSDNDDIANSKGSVADSAISRKAFIQHLISSEQKSSKDDQVNYLEDKNLNQYLLDLIFQYPDKDITNNKSKMQELDKINSKQLIKEIETHFSKTLTNQQKSLIRLIDQIFLFIKNQLYVKDAIKKIIFQLKLPLLVLAQRDHQCLIDENHPARNLLNDICKLSLYWKQENAQTNIIIEQITYSVQQICSTIHEYAQASELFEMVNQRFSIFTKNFLKKIDIFEKRTREAEQGKAKAEAARKLAKNETNKLLSVKDLPSFIRAFIKDAWQHVIFLECLKFDLAEDIQETQDSAIFTAKTLIISLQPTNTIEKLEKFLTIQTRLLEKLNADIDKSPYSYAESQIFFEALENIHSDIIEQAKISLEKGQKEEVLRLKPKDSLKISLDIEQQNNSEIEENNDDLSLEEWIIYSYQKLIGKSNDLLPTFQKQTSHEQTLEEKVTETQPVKNSTQIFKKLNPGDRVNFKLDKKCISYKLVTYIQTNDKYIFADSSGTKVAEYSGLELNQMFQEKQFTLINDQPLFDQAIDFITRQVNKIQNPKSEQNSDSDSKTISESKEKDKNENKPKPIEKNQNLLEVNQEDNERIKQLTVGSWVNLKIENRFKKCKLAAKIASSGKYIFTNRSGQKVIEANLDKLIALYQIGELTLDQQTEVFDQALSSVIKSMRRTKTGE